MQPVNPSGQQINFTPTQLCNKDHGCIPPCRISQLRPEKPVGHSQYGASAGAMHRPPFWQVKEAQELRLIAEIKTKNGNVSITLGNGSSNYVIRKY